MDFDFTDPAGWFDLLRPGSFPNETALADGKRYVVQVITAQDLAGLIAVWKEQGRPELMIDREHESHKPGGSSVALGWVKDLRLKKGEDGIYKLQALAKWTAEGEAAVKGGNYRYCSASVGTTPIDSDPPADAGKDAAHPVPVRLVILRRIGLTNIPAVEGLLPISNSRPLDGGGSTTADPATPPTPPTTKPTTPKKMDPKKLAALLGLPDTATEAEIEAKLAEILNSTKAMAEEAAETTLEEYKNCIPDASRSFFKDALVTNRKVTMEVLKGLQAKAAGTGPEIRVHNRSAATPPETRHAATQPADNADRGAQQRAAILEVRNRGNHRLSYEDAFNVAAAEKPELFLEPSPITA